MSSPLSARAAALALALASGCGTGQLHPPDVLLITVDTLRHDYVSAYGEDWARTPALDAVGSAGAVFERHYATASMTAPSHATIFTGRYPREHGLRKNGGVIDEATPVLAEAFERAGYRTLGAIGARVVDHRFGFGRGFQEFDEHFDASVLIGTKRPNLAERRASTVVDRAIEMLAAEDQRPVFMWVHVYDPHTPLSSPIPESRSPEQLRRLFAKTAESSRTHSREYLVQLHAAYEREVRYTDRQLGRLLDAWDARPGGAKSIVAVTSDHGEGLGEHEYAGHGAHLFEEQLHIPLLLRAPGQIDPGTRIDGVSSAVDLAATLLQLARLPTPPGLGGRSLLPLIRGQAPGSERVAIAERRVYSEFDQRTDGNAVKAMHALWGPDELVLGDRVSLVRDDWKLLWDEHRPSELYDLSRDPGEHHNQIDVEPERAHRLLTALMAWRQAAEAAGAGMGATLEDDPEVRRMLEDLGY